MVRIATWVFVVLVGIDLGAGLYETGVVVPLWSAGVPETLAAGNAYGHVAIRAGMRFWSIVSPLAVLGALAVLVAGLRAPKPHRGWMLAAGLLELVVSAATFTYFAPTARRLFLTHGAGLGAASLASTVRTWVALNYGRCAITAVAWLAGIKALAQSFPG